MHPQLGVKSHKKPESQHLLKQDMATMKQNTDQNPSTLAAWWNCWGCAPLSRAGWVDGSVGDRKEYKGDDDMAAFAAAHHEGLKNRHTSHAPALRMNAPGKIYSSLYIQFHQHWNLH